MELADAITEGKILRCKLEFIKLEKTDIKDDNGKYIIKETNKGLCDGPIKPDITFFGEPLSIGFFDAWDKISNAPKFDQRIFP